MLHSLLAGAWLDSSSWIILPHCLFSALVTVIPVLIVFSKQTGLHPAICTCTVKTSLGIFSFFMLPFLFLARVQQKGKLRMLPFPVCVGLAQLLLSAWEKERLAHCWLSLCTQAVHGTADHSDTSPSAVAPGTHRRRMPCSVAKESSMALLLFGV